MPVSYIDFIEERLEIGIDYGVVGGPSFKTEILLTGSGKEQRNATMWQPKGRWQLGDRMLLDSNIEGINEVLYLQDFHTARQGSKQGFRFRDWCDYRAIDQPIGTTDGITTQWQLKKIYQVGSEFTFRPILKPVLGSVKLYLDGVEVYPSINYSNGLISFAVPPQSGQLLTADFEFDVPVQFEADKVEWTLKAVQLGTEEFLHKLGSVFVKEMRIDPDLEWYNFDPIPKTIEQPLDLGIILDVSETITYDTRFESIDSGYSAVRGNSGDTTIFKLPSYTFNQKQLNALLDYFWLAKGRLIAFPLILNNRTHTVRFNTDSLSVKFIATDNIDSLYEVNLEFIKPNILFFDSETYVKTIIDSSGSMNAYVAPVVEAVNNLKEFLKNNVYLTEENTNKYFKPISYSGNEDWLNWTNEDLRDDKEEPNKQVFLIWINEANPIYHNPSNTNMTPAFESHLNTFLSTFEERTRFRTFIYSVNPYGTPGGIEGFETHLNLAKDGASNYSVPLKDYGFIFRPGIDPNVTAEFYFNDILNS